MKIHRCTFCKTKGGFLTFRETSWRMRIKYPYVGHYDPTKKSKRRWSELNKKQLNQIQFRDDWYQIDYIQLIKNSQEKYLITGIDSLPKELIVELGNLLENNGFLKYRIGERIFYDFYYN